MKTLFLIGEIKDVDDNKVINKLIRFFSIVEVIRIVDLSEVSSL